MMILVLDFCKQNFLRLSDDYTRLLSTKDVTGKVWIVWQIYMKLSQVVILCSFCWTVWLYGTNLKRSFPFSKSAWKISWIISQLLDC